MEALPPNRTTKPAAALILFFGASLSVFASDLRTQMPLATPPGGMVLVCGGDYQSPFRSQNQPTQFLVKPFYLDIFPITNEDFLEFVRANPQWRRSRVPRRLTDESYLQHWAGDIDLGTANPKAPASQVSWFAARAYAHWRGKRLPKIIEWEWAAKGSAPPDGARQPEFNQQILRWYATPAPAQLPSVGSRRTNDFGLHDLHGLIWEWVADFDATWVTDAIGADSKKFCGGAAQGAKDPSDYATFMRFGFRSSLRPEYCIRNLGFRCAMSVGPPAN